MSAPGHTPGDVHDNRLCSVLLAGLRPQTIVLADRGYDADWIREFVRDQGAWAAAGRSVWFAAADWTDEERRIAIAQNSRLCGMPDENCFTDAPKKPAKT
jgi:hypothetical protein